MRVIFVGGKSVGYGVLTHLMKNDEVLAVFTNPSDLSNKVWYPSIRDILKSFRKEKNPKKVNSYTTDNINLFKDEITDWEPEWIVCVYYDRLIQKEIISIPSCGSINVHMGLAEEYRGCYPTTFPIINGDDRAGATIHQMTEAFDDGPIYSQATVTVDKSDTGGSLYFKCTGAAIELFTKSWDKIKKGQLKPRKQITTERTKVYKRTDFPSLEVDLSWDKEKLDRYIRALTFPPFPRPYFVMNNKKFDIHFNG